jgi:DNA-binding NarL/FixJ family response regulator
MILVIALPDLALRLSGLLHNARYIVRVEDGKDLRHRVHSYQPDVVVLDWRIGGSMWRALDEVTAIVERTTTHPYVIALLPKTSPRIKSEAAKLGCYDVISVNASGVDRKIVDAVELAQRARAARRAEHRRVSRAHLH